MKALILLCVFLCIVCPAAAQESSDLQMEMDTVIGGIDFSEIEGFALFGVAEGTGVESAVRALAGGEPVIEPEDLLERFCR